MFEAIIEACRANWPGHVCLEDTDEGTDFDQLVVDAYNDLIPDSGTISIREVEGLLVVRLEKN